MLLTLPSICFAEICLNIKIKVRGCQILDYLRALECQAAAGRTFRLVFIMVRNMLSIKKKVIQKDDLLHKLFNVYFKIIGAHFFQRFVK